MAISASPDMDEPFNNLSEKRQDIINAWAELYNELGEEPKNVDVADRADANESYTSQTLSEYKDIAEQRADVLANQRNTGSETTTGDPLEGLEKEREVQTIQERPRKGSSSTQANQAESVVSLDLNEQEVRDLVEGENVPEWLRTRLMDELLDRAF